jgi:hypothetical protein
MFASHFTILPAMHKSKFKLIDRWIGGSDATCAAVANAIVQQRTILLYCFVMAVVVFQQGDERPSVAILVRAGLPTGVGGDMAAAVRWLPLKTKTGSAWRVAPTVADLQTMSLRRAPA